MESIDSTSSGKSPNNSDHLPEITDKQKSRLVELGCQCLSRQPIAVVRFFSSFGEREWYVTEYIEKTNIYCGIYVDSQREGFEEWDSNYFKEQELKMGSKIKRCRAFAETPITIISEGILEYRRVMLTEFTGFRIYNHDPVYRDEKQSIFIPIMKFFKRYANINGPKIINLRTYNQE